MKNYIVRILFVFIWLQFPFLFYTQNLDAAEWYKPDDIGSGHSLEGLSGRPSDRIPMTIICG